MGDCAIKTSKPKPTEISIIGKPKAIPKRCGNDFLIPKLSPEDKIIILFGPGVMVITSVNKKIDSRLSTA
jgi:hypothetical protein